MAEVVLNVETGRDLGSRSSRRLRREDRVPGVIYGLDSDPTSFSVDYGDLRRALTTDAGLNALIQIDTGGGQELSILKDLQRHPVRDEVTHVDFIRIDADAELSVDVNLILEGEAKDVTDQDGMVDQALFQMTVLAAPQSIPNEIIIDVTDLKLHDSIRVADVVLPAGVRTEMDPEEAVAIGTVTRSTLEAMAAEEAAEAEGELGEEGAAAGEGGDDSADDSGDADSE